VSRRSSGLRRSGPRTAEAYASGESREGRTEQREDAPHGDGREERAEAGGGPPAREAPCDEGEDGEQRHHATVGGGERRLHLRRRGGGDAHDGKGVAVAVVAQHCLAGHGAFRRGRKCGRLPGLGVHVGDLDARLAARQQIEVAEILGPQVAPDGHGQGGGGDALHLAVGAADRRRSDESGRHVPFADEDVGAVADESLQHHRVAGPAGPGQRAQRQGLHGERRLLRQVGVERFEGGEETVEGGAVAGQRSAGLGQRADAGGGALHQAHELVLPPLEAP